MLIIFVSLFLSVWSIQADGDLTVSGLSSGAYFATQFHFAHSSKVKGSGMFAGGPMFCALGDMSTATGACMAKPSKIDIPKIQKKIDSFEKDGYLDPTENLEGAPVYVFHGTKDSTVKQDVGLQGITFWEGYGVDMKQETSIASEHTLPTDNHDLHGCSVKGEPWISDCDYDGAYEALQHLSQKDLNKPVAMKEEHLFTFKQADSAPSMADTGYAYIPKQCQDSNHCDIHVSFHGCEQVVPSIGLLYVEQTGFDEVAEANDIIVLFPEAVRSYFSPLNPKGCWDWWGYNELATIFSPAWKYATKEGDQIQSVMSYVEALQEGSLEFEPVSSRLVSE